jgi:dipeptidyl aminopeptidase/acylaminoacyl peptidase
LVLHEVSSGTETVLHRHPGLTSSLLEPSPDGQSLLFAVTDSTWSGLSRGTPLYLQDAVGKLMLVRLPGGDVEELLAVDLEPGVRITTVEWGPHGRYVYFTERTRGESTVLKRVPLSGGEVEQVWVFRKGGSEFSISPTGHQVAFTIGENQGDIYIMENLAAALRARSEGR